MWNGLERIEELEDEVDLLRQIVDALQLDHDSLDDALERHTHTYLTGRGEGHNQVEVDTGPAEVPLE